MDGEEGLSGQGELARRKSLSAATTLCQALRRVLEDSVELGGFNDKQE